MTEKRIELHQKLFFSKFFSTHKYQTSLETCFLMVIRLGLLKVMCSKSFSMYIIIVLFRECELDSINSKKSCLVFFVKL